MTSGFGGQLGTYTAEGITKLCEGLKESAVTSLKCAAAPPECSLSYQRPLTRLLSRRSPLPLARSLGFNIIGAEGATALAPLLNETNTMITNLKYAAPAMRLLLCQRP